MDSIFDLIFNANDLAEDTVVLSEINVEINKIIFNALMKTQEYMVDQYGKLKTDIMKKSLEEGIKSGFVTLLEAEKTLNKAKNDLREAKKQARKIL